MKKITIALILLVAVMAVALVGCGGAPSTISGLWYEETGYGGTIEFKGGGSFTQQAMGFKLDGKYTFDEATSEGEATIEFMGEKSTSSFSLQGDKIIMDGATFTRTKVEQKSMEDLFGEMQEAFEGMGDMFQE